MAQKTVGQVLRAKRAKLDMTLNEAENLTKIQKTYIVALEQDNYDALPGDFYIKAYIKQYAERLDLDSDKMISAYENGKSEPSIATLMQMADIFNTSVDYIIGYTNIRQPIDKTVQMSLNEDECDLLGGYRELSAKQQNIALGVILGLLNSEKN